MTAVPVKMADDREPPALFDDDADTPESRPDEETNGELFIGETTEITLDDDGSKDEEVPVESDKGPADGAGDDQEQKTETSAVASETSAAASVDVTNLSKPSEDERKPPAKEKAEVGM